jgi:hypothetical protein
MSPKAKTMYRIVCIFLAAMFVVPMLLTVILR